VRDGASKYAKLVLELAQPPQFKRQLAPGFARIVADWPENRPTHGRKCALQARPCIYVRSRRVDPTHLSPALAPLLFMEDLRNRRDDVPVDLMDVEN